MPQEGERRNTDWFSWRAPAGRRRLMRALYRAAPHTLMTLHKSRERLAEFSLVVMLARRASRQQRHRMSRRVGRYHRYRRLHCHRESGREYREFLGRAAGTCLTQAATFSFIIFFDKSMIILSRIPAHADSHRLPVGTYEVARY